MEPVQDRGAVVPYMRGEVPAFDAQVMDGLREATPQTIKGRKCEYLTPLLIGFGGIAVGMGIFFGSRIGALAAIDSIGRNAALIIGLGGTVAGLGIMIGSGCYLISSNKSYKAAAFRELNDPNKTAEYYANRATKNELINVLSHIHHGKIAESEFSNAEQQKFNIIKGRIHGFIRQENAKLTDAQVVPAEQAAYKANLVNMRNLAVIANYRFQMSPNEANDRFGRLYAQHVERAR